MVFKKNGILLFFTSWRSAEEWERGVGRWYIWGSSLDGLGNNNNKAGIGSRVGWLMEIQYQTVQVCMIYLEEALTPLAHICPH
jgi:hypothetical protein